MKYIILIGAMVLAAAAMNGAVAQQAPAIQLPDPRPLGRELAPADPAAALREQAAEIPRGELTLRQALVRTLLNNPDLAAFSWKIRVREAELLQAGLRPNPELGAEVENFLGSGPYHAFDSSETTISIRQLIRRGGKREKGQAVAALDAELAGWDWETRRLDVLTAATKAFVAVLAAQQQVEQADELAGLTERFLATVGERVDAGVSSPVERTRAEVALSAQRIAQAQARIALESARKALAALWGDDTAAFDRAAGSIEPLDPVPPADWLAALLVQNPDLARWDTEYRERDARLEFEKAKAVPDLTVSGGFRWLQEARDGAFVGGVSIPLPWSDRNQGGIAAAAAARNQARQAGRAARNQALAVLNGSLRDLNSAYASAKTLREQTLPAATQAMETVDAGYRAGKFGFLELLDAQRTLFEVKGQYTQALAAYHQARADVERLVGAPLDSTGGSNPEEK